MQINRERAARLGEETRQILEQRRYTDGAGAVVEIGPLLDQALAGARSYPAEQPLPPAQPEQYPTAIQVRNESTLAAARRLASQGQRPLALNFASAKHPGGGWLNGAIAQEESLARASGLVACIAGNPMYARNAALGDAIYTDDAIYTPDVPVFRDDDGQLLAEPYLCAFITMPARTPASCWSATARAGQRCAPQWSAVSAGCWRSPRSTATAPSCSAPGAAGCSATTQRR